MKHILPATMILALAGGIASAGEPVSYSVGGETFEGYFAAASDPAGTVVILPTWNGLSDYEKDRAQMLTDLGYNAFAADLYEQGAHPATMEERQAGLQALISDRDRMHALLTAAIDEARKHGDDPLVVMGYSMGAITAMELAWSGLGNASGVDGYAIFSGRVSDTSGRMMPDGVAPFFVAHGEADTQIQSSGIESFVDDVELAGGRATVRIYPGAGHLFSAFGFPNYDEAADRDSWAALTAFLRDVSDSN